MAANTDKTEHFEVWYVDPATGSERHQKADDIEQATEIAAEYKGVGLEDVTIHKIVTTVSDSIVKVDIPD